jgi:arylsulfatase A-like enzyme/Flp pilus assembly protein TadD
LERKRARLAALVVLACGLAGCRERALGPFPRAPVVLVSIDTLRADRLPAYGYTKGRTPALDALAREAVVFEEAVSPCPLTLPAHASLLTGLWPPRHGVRDNVGFTLASDRATLASRYRAAGRPTGAAVSAFVLRASTGIAAGFDQYDDALTVDAAVSALGAQQRDGAVAVESLLGWIGPRAKQAFFAFLHLYEPHTPYTPPERHRGLAHPYDGEIAYADELVGRLLDGLRRSGAYDDAIVIVTSDHGEALGEHGESEHGFFLYRETLRVPLIVRLPGGRRGGTRVAGLAQLVDVPATLLDLAGLDAGGLDGRSLREALGTGRLEARTAYAETFYPRFHFGWSELVGARDERFSFVRAPRPELYDWKADPGETRNLAGEREAAAAGMDAWLGRALGGAAAPTPAAVPGEVQEALRALGYVTAGAPARTAPAGSARADPKDKIAVYESYRNAAAHRTRGDEARAVAELRRVLAEEPQMLDAWEELGGALLRLGREQEGIAALERALEGDPERSATHLALARAHAFAGRMEQAVRHATAATARDPGQANELLAQLALGGGRFDEARARARRSLDADPQRALSHFVLGVLEQREGRFESALASFRRAAEAQALQKRLVIPGVHARAADCLARLGRTGEAEAEFRAEIAAIPHTREGRIGLALLLRSLGRDLEARETVAGIVAAHPNPGPEEYAIVVRTLAGIGDQAGAREWQARAQQRFRAGR